MKHLSIAIIILAFLNSCQQSRKAEDIRVPPREVGADTTDGKQYKTIILDVGVPKDMSLSDQEMMTIDIVLNKKVQQFNIEEKARYYQWKKEYPNSSTKLADVTIDLRYYKRQYIIALNKKGEKIVHVNCFCSHGDSDYWKTNIIEVMDGGKCYFSLVLNLDTNQLIYFQANGIA